VRLRRLLVAKAAIGEWLRHGTPCVHPSEQMPDDLVVEFVRESDDGESLELIVSSDSFEYATGKPIPLWQPAFAFPHDARRLPSSS